MECAFVSIPPSVKRPTLAAIIEQIQTIEAAHARGQSIDELTSLLEPVFLGYQIRAPRCNVGQLLYRAIRVSGRPNHRSEVWYPPVECTRNNRASRKGDRLLYCSADQLSALHESGANSGMWFAVAHILVEQKLTLAHIGFHEEVLRERGKTRDVPRFAAPTDRSEQDQCVDRFLARIFTEPSKPGDTEQYNLTIALAERFLKARKGACFCGLLYPSVAGGSGASDNVAIHCERADAALRVVKAELLEIVADGEVVRAEVRDVARGITDAGELEWLGRPEKWSRKNIGDELQTAFEGGIWVARKPNGELVPPD